MTPSSPPSYTFLEPSTPSLLLHHIHNTTPMGHNLPTPPVIHSGPNSPPTPPIGPTHNHNQPTPPTGHAHQPTYDTTSIKAHRSPIPHHTTQLQSSFFIPNINPAPAWTHTMVTQSQRGIVKPLKRLSLHTSSVSPIPKSPFHALKDSNWCNAMYDDQQLSVDFDETFSSVVKPAIIRMVLSLAVSRQWPIHQLDVNNAFFNGDLSETAYMHQPHGFVDSRYPNHGSQVAYLLIYIDDIILTASSLALLQQIVDSLHTEFDMTDLGALNFFLGISAVRHPTGLFLSQKKILLYTAVLQGGFSILPLLAQICYAVQQGTLELGLHLYASATTSLVGYTDADWAGCPSTR
nr:hypothetical protein [Tanacetum cinerariifolium]